MVRAGAKLPLAALGGVAVAGLVLALRSSGSGERSGFSDSAPGRTARRQRFGDFAVAGKTVTISQPSRKELFRFWRDFSNLPAFMENLKSVEDLGGGRSRWTIRAPHGTVTIESEIAMEQENELIAWRSVDGSDIETEGRVAFRDAPCDRGTHVELIIAYKPPLGRAGQTVAKLLQREPSIQARRDLRRFKSLMETGEIATSRNRRMMEETV